MRVTTWCLVLLALPALAESVCRLTTSAPAVLPIWGVRFHAADFDGDRKADILAANTMLYGRGDGTFEPPVIVPGSGGNTFIADFNGDGRIDIAGAIRTRPVGAPATDEVVVLTNDGDRSFAPPKAVASGRPIVVADFNGDGRPDIAIVAANQRETFLVINNPDNTFSGPTGRIPEVPDSAGRPAGGDVDGDGNADLIFGTRTLGIRIHRGDSKGGFLPGWWTLGPNAFGRVVVVGDTNDDRRSDVIALYSDFVGIHQGPVGFGSRLTASHNIDGLPENATTGDFNGDGRTDLAVMASHGLQMYLNDGAGALTPGAHYGSGYNGSEIATSDFNGDGFLDLAIAESDEAMSVIFGNGDGTFRAPSVLRAAGRESEGGIIAAEDLNSDGIDELIAISPAGAFVGRRTARLVYAYDRLPVTGSGQYPVAANAVAVGDVHETPGLEVIAPDGTKIALFTRDGEQWRQVGSYETHAEIQAAAAVDGHVAAISGDVLYVAANGTTLRSVATFGSSDWFMIRVADIDRNGHADLIVARSGWGGRNPFDGPDFSSGEMFFLRGYGGGMFAPPIRLLGKGPDIYDSPGHGIHDFAVADFTADGNPDIAVSLPATGVLLMRGDGRGGFAQSLVDMRRDASLAAGDVDGDGVADLVVNDRSTRSVFYTPTYGLSLYRGTSGGLSLYGTWLTGIRGLLGGELERGDNTPWWWSATPVIARIQPNARPAVLASGVHNDLMEARTGVIEFDCAPRRRATRHP